MARSAGQIARATVMPPVRYAQARVNWKLAPGPTVREAHIRPP